MTIEREDNKELRETLLALFRKLHPNGKIEAQKQVCEELPEERIRYYIEMFESSKKAQKIV
jgi:hypothetical protein